MNVSLPPVLDEFVTSRVQSGRYQTSSEVVRAGLRLLQEQETVLEEVRRKIAIGLEQARRGELFDGEQVFAEFDRLADETQAQPVSWRVSSSPLSPERI